MCLCFDLCVGYEFAGFEYPNTCQFGKENDYSLMVFEFNFSILAVGGILQCASRVCVAYSFFHGSVCSSTQIVAERIVI